MKDIWKWIERFSWIIAIVAFIRGWSIMNKIIEIWNNLSAWQFVFFLSVPIIIFSFIRDYIKLKKFHNESYDVFHQWLIDNRNTNYPHMAETSLEGRIVAMLEWWDSRKKL